MLDNGLGVDLLGISVFLPHKKPNTLCFSSSQTATGRIRMTSLRAALILLVSTFGLQLLSAQTDPEYFRTVSSLSGSKWTLQDTSPLPETTASVPSILVLPNNDIHVFFCSGTSGTRSATSKDGGKTFTLDSGTQLGSCDGTFIYLTNGQFRFIGQDGSDGLFFTKESGIRYTGSPNDYNSTNVPSVVKLSDGSHRIYYVGDIDPAPPEGDTIRTAISTDEGVTWTPENTTGVLPSGYVDPCVIKLNNGGYRLFYRVNRPAFPTVDRGIAFADSDDGINFTHVEIVLSDGELADPAVIKLPDGSLKMFCGYNDNRLRSATAVAISELNFAQIGNGLGFGSDLVFCNPSSTSKRLMLGW